MSINSYGAFRAVVSRVSSSTGEIIVRMPPSFGTDLTASISTIGRTSINGVWPVPTVGEQVLVVSDDENLTNVFIVDVSPSLNKLKNLENRVYALEHP